MPARFLLDTNICIYIIRHKPAEVRERFERLEAGAAVLSVITFGELQFGIAKSRHAAAAARTLSELITHLPVLPLPAEAGVEYGRLRAAAEAKGTPVGNNDLWIAAHAKAAGLTLVSNNLREFRRLPGLRLENWVRA